MTKTALDFEFEHEELYNDVRKETTRDKFMAEILDMSANALKRHTKFSNVELQTGDMSKNFRKKELIAIMSALNGLTSTLDTCQNMSRLDHLKAAVFGQ